MEMKMDLHIIVKIKSSYQEWKALFDLHSEKRAQLCDESKTLVGEVDTTTATVTLFSVDVEAMGAMMADPEFIKMTEEHVEEHIRYVINPLSPPQ